MMRAVAKRIALMAPTLLGIALIAFAVVRAMPGDPLAAQGDGALQAGGATLAQMSAYRRQMGLDDPLLPGFARWLLRLVTGDLGSSFRDGRAVSAVLGEALPMTLLLSIPSLLIGYLVAIPAGILSAARPDGPVDRALSWLAFFVYSLPVQWIALMAIVGVSGSGWPIQGWNGPRSLLLPVVLIASVLAIRRGARFLAQPLALLVTPFLAAAVFIGEPRYRTLYDVFGLMLVAGLAYVLRGPGARRPATPR